MNLIGAALQVEQATPWLLGETVNDLIDFMT